MSNLHIVGEYNHYGYRIISADGEQEFYRAGNAVADSTSILPLTARHVVPLRKLRAWCIRETREEAAKQEATYGGVSRVDDNEG